MAEIVATGLPAGAAASATAQTTPRIITVGETMAMVAPRLPEPLETAQDFLLDSGGAESNVAAHCVHRGIPAAWVSAVGDDALGRRVVAMIRRRGVDTRWVRVDPSRPTGVYFKDPGAGVLYYRRGSAASAMSEADLADVPIASADIVHASGINLALSDSCSAMMAALLRIARESGVAVSFDVNFRPALWPVAEAGPACLAFAQRADTVFVGLDEARVLWGCETAAEVREVLTEPRLVVKDADRGATEFDGGDSVFVPALAVDVVEPVGAGDAFAGGYLAALVAGRDARDRLAAGHRQAALVLRSATDFLPEGMGV